MWGRPPSAVRRAKPGNVLARSKQLEADFMSDTILVVVEQREGKLNRVYWETITAGQTIAAATGWTLEAAIVGASVSALAAEVAAKKVAKVYAIESPRLEPYTPDAFAAALKQFLTTKRPQLVLMPHTYQVRDFVPKLATAMGRTVISDCIASSTNTESSSSPGRCFRASSLPTSA